MNLNKIFVLGRLTADPQLRSIPTGQQVANFGVATNRVWFDKKGARQDETEFHNIVVWGRQAEVASQFLVKGSLVLIEGRIRTRTWQNKEGQNQKTTEIICERLQLGPKPAGQSSAGSNMSANKQGFTPDKQPASEGVDASPKEQLPEINIDDEEIKPEDLPF